MSALTLTSQSIPRRRRERLTVLKGLISLMRKWNERSKGRSELARMSGRTLQDIGLTPYDAYLEVNKPFWRE